MTGRLLLALLLVQSVLLHTNAENRAPNVTDIENLETILFHGDGSSLAIYDPSLRPQPFDDLEVSAGFNLLGIVYVDEKQGWFGVSALFEMEWLDSRLTWQPDHYGNIRYLHMDAAKLWIPHFTHSGHRYFGGSISVSLLNLTNDGRVRAYLNFNDDVPCTFDLTDFPRDTQKCSVVIIAHSDLKVNLKAKYARTVIKTIASNNLKDTNHHKAWEVTEVEMTDGRLDIGVGSPALFVITITMKRNPSFFLKAYVAPICFILLLMPMLFLLPPDSTEKLTFGVILLFCMIFITDRIDSLYPSHGESTPYLVCLTMAGGALLFICLLLTSIVSSAERIGRTRPIPSWVKRYVLGIVGPYLFVQDTSNTPPAPVKVKVHDESETAGIIPNEQGDDFVEHETLGNYPPDDRGKATRAALNALVDELLRSRKSQEANECWTNVFTVVNRLLFLLTLLIAVILILCFA